MTRDEYGKAFQENFNRTVRGLMARGATIDQAWEIAQATWARGWEKCGQLRDDRRVGAWIFASALHRKDDFFAALTRTRQLSPEEAQIAIDEGDPILSIEVRRAIEKCNPGHRLILEQLYFEGYSERELAEVSGLSVASIRGRAYRARQAMREHLAQ